MSPIPFYIDMEFRTRTELPAGEAEIRHADRLLLWGSCFTESIGERLAAAKFRCLQNPFGVLYNPLSIATALQQVEQRKVYTSDDLFYDRGLWGSRMHHSSFSAADREECLRKVNDGIAAGAAFLDKADWLVLTFGTAWVYEWKADGSVVGNCHKLPERLFSRRLLRVEEIACAWQSLLEELRTAHPQLHVLFTVSPIRHTKDGLHGNQLSKATLLLAVDCLCTSLPFCHYFPSYEILLDELRDYRFYADDMYHPSRQAVDYIWECFSATYFSEATRRLVGECQEVRRAAEHRPFHPESEAHQQFKARQRQHIARLKESYPYLDFREEEQRLQ